MLCHMCRIGSYWLHGKCAQYLQGIFCVWLLGSITTPAALCGGTQHPLLSKSLMWPWKNQCDLPVGVSSAIYRSPLALTVPFLAFFFLCSAGIAVGFYGNGETSDGIHRLTYSLRHANRTVAGVQDRVSTKAKGIVWEWAGFLSTPLESGCASISAFFLLASELRDVLKFPLMERCFLQLF